MRIMILLLQLLLLFSVGLRPVVAEDAQGDALVSLLQQRALPLTTEADLIPLLNRAGKTRLVLLGDASHGTYDFYRLRAHLTQRLLLDQDFSFIAVEGDWEGVAAVDSYVRNLPGAAKSAAAALTSLRSWPGWVWNNREMERLVIWLHQLNLQRPLDKRIPIYGMDLLGFAASLKQLVHRPETAGTAKLLKNCLLPYLGNPLRYPEALQQEGAACGELGAGLEKLLTASVGGSSFSLAQQIRIVVNAEAYYRAMATSSVEAWNRRVAHFADTLVRLLARHGAQGKGIVWAHNTHIGDARATAMAESGMQSLGELLRRRFDPETLLLVGSTSYQGTVLASRQWGGPMEPLLLPAAAAGSFEELMHRTGLEVAYWLFQTTDRDTGPLAIARGQRGVGVVYEPEFDGRDNYLGTRLPARYDALVFVDTSTALEPLGEDETRGDSL